MIKEEKIPNGFHGKHLSKERLSNCDFRKPSTIVAKTYFKAYQCSPYRYYQKIAKVIELKLSSNPHIKSFHKATIEAAVEKFIFHLVKIRLRYKDMQSKMIAYHFFSLVKILGGTFTGSLERKIDNAYSVLSILYKSSLIIKSRLGFYKYIKAYLSHLEKIANLQSNKVIKSFHKKLFECTVIALKITNNLKDFTLTLNQLLNSYKDSGIRNYIPLLMEALANHLYFKVNSEEMFDFLTMISTNLSSYQNTLGLSPYKEFLEMVFERFIKVVLSTKSDFKDFKKAASTFLNIIGQKGFALDGMEKMTSGDESTIFHIFLERMMQEGVPLANIIRFLKEDLLVILNNALNKISFLEKDKFAIEWAPFHFIIKKLLEILEHEEFANQKNKLRGYEGSQSSEGNISLDLGDIELIRVNNSYYEQVYRPIIKKSSITKNNSSIQDESFQDEECSFVDEEVSLKAEIEKILNLYYSKPPIYPYKIAIYVTDSFQKQKLVTPTADGSTRYNLLISKRESDSEEIVSREFDSIEVVKVSGTMMTKFPLSRDLNPRLKALTNALVTQGYISNFGNKNKIILLSPGKDLLIYELFDKEVLHFLSPSFKSRF